MSTMTRVAAWQCHPGPLDVAGNLKRLDEACARAAAERVDVLVTPEMFTSGYGLTPDQVLTLAEDAGGPTDEAVAQLARRHGLAIVYGHPERAPGGAAYNAATLVGRDGVIRGRHRKVHLFGDVDRLLFAPNPERPTAFDVDGDRVGMLICYDVEFPEAVRRLAADGARTVLVPTANMAGFEQVQELLVRARACENGCSLVYANYCGADALFTYNGRSEICGPGGEVLAQARPDGEELVIADLPAEPRGTYLADRRADLYAAGLHAVEDREHGQGRGRRQDRAEVGRAVGGRAPGAVGRVGLGRLPLLVHGHVGRVGAVDQHGDALAPGERAGGGERLPHHVVGPVKRVSPELQVEDCGNRHGCSILGDDHPRTTVPHPPRPGECAPALAQRPRGRQPATGEPVTGGSHRGPFEGKCFLSRTDRE